MPADWPFKLELLPARRGERGEASAAAVRVRAAAVARRSLVGDWIEESGDETLGWYRGVGGSGSRRAKLTSMDGNVLLRLPRWGWRPAMSPVAGSRGWWCYWPGGKPEWSGEKAREEAVAGLAAASVSEGASAAVDDISGRAPWARYISSNSSVSRCRSSSRGESGDGGEAGDRAVVVGGVGVGIDMDVGIG